MERVLGVALQTRILGAEVAQFVGELRASESSRQLNLPHAHTRGRGVCTRGTASLPLAAVLGVYATCMARCVSRKSVAPTSEYLDGKARLEPPTEVIVSHIACSSVRRSG